MTAFLRAPFFATMLGIGLVTAASAQDLSSFAILAGSTVTNTGPSVINGNLGVSPGSALTGFPPGVITAPYTSYVNNAVADNAQSQLTTAYNVLAGQAATANLTGQDLGGKTLVAGVYSFNSSAQLTGTLTLDGQGKKNSIFIFNIASTLDTAAASRVLLINGANANNVFFRVGSSATLLAGTAFQGKILALTSISLLDAASINCGAALARNGAVTLINNTIGVCPMIPGTTGPTTSGGENGTAVGDAIDDYIASGGTIPVGLGVLGLMTPEELAAALGELTGETATGGQYTTGQAMDAFLQQLSGRRAPGDLIRRSGPPQQGPDENTVSVMGYADATPVPGQAAFAGFGANQAMPDVARWQVWSAAYGNYSLVKGDAAAGTTERSSAAYGLTFGIERAVTSDAMFGLALSGGGTNFDLDDSLGSGHSAMLQAAAYGRVESDRAYVSAAAAYGIHDMHMQRSVTLLGTDVFAARYVMQDIAGQAEVGYHIGWLTPYAGVRVQSIRTPGYSETTTSGASTYALDYAAHTLLTARTEIGARAEWVKEIESGTVVLHANAAWAHTFATDRSITASFSALPGTSFKIAGAMPAADAVLLGIGTDLELTSGLALGVSLDSSLSTSAQSYSGNAHLGYSW